MVAVDVMSGEMSPEIIVKGALKAVRELDINVALIGDEEHIATCLKKLKFQDRRHVKIYSASEVIGMHEKPSLACKKKKDSSIMVCTKLANEGKVSGLFSPGNTGATLVASLMNIGRIEGILRPGLASFIPTLKGTSIIIDAGANIDCLPSYLAQFAIMGEVFAKKVQGKKNPSVGILSIGEEKSKGNDLSRKTYDILKNLDFNFTGNIEGYDIYSGDIDVIVCDGFVGNIVLKVTETIFKFTFEFVWEQIGYHFLQRIGFALTYPAIKKLISKTDPREYGGAFLLGLNSNIVIGHGTSDSLTTYNAVKKVNFISKNKISSSIIERLNKFGLTKSQ